MEFTNSQDLFNALTRQMNTAMGQIRTQAEADMKAETAGYYEGTVPVIYKRTYHLKNSPKTSGITSSASEVSFEAYLDQGYTYPSITYGRQRPSKSPTMTDVLNLTNYRTSAHSSVGYLHPAIGIPGFWERANDRMKNTVTSTLKNFFPT